MKSKLIFFGTQDFGAGILLALIESGEYDIVTVVTQPDRPVGRKHELEASPVKQLAQKHGLKVLQPESLKNFEPIADIDVGVVCQYGLIIPQTVLDIPKKGMINVHTSLLPKYRGASPIQSALMHGDTVTGVTIMLMDAKMDHGPLLSQGYVSIDSNDTYQTLSASMAPVAQNLLIRTLRDWLDGNTQPTEQDHAQASFCTLLNRDDGKLDFHKNKQELYNIYRGTFPWPGAWTTWDGKRLKLLNVKPSHETSSPGAALVKDGKLFIGCADGSLEILELQLEGKKAMSAEQFLAGHTNINGAQLQ